MKISQPIVVHKAEDAKTRHALGRLRLWARAHLEPRPGQRIEGLNLKIDGGPSLAANARNAVESDSKPNYQNRKVSNFSSRVRKNIKKTHLR
jgi:hypothetical protein